MKKIKVLHMPVTNSGSGVTQYILQNLRFIDKEKFQFDFVTFSNKLDFEDEVKTYGGKVHYLKTRPEENRNKFINDMHNIFDEVYDAIHLHTSYWKNFLVEEIAVERKISKIIVHSHSTMIDILDDKKREEAILLHNNQKQLFNKELATDFIACSSEASRWLFGENIPKEEIKIYKNAIDEDNFRYKEKVRNEYRKRLNIEDCFVLGHVGRFVYQKNHNFLIDVFHEISKGVDNVRLILVGEGPLENDVREKLKKYGLIDKVLFLGRRKDVNNIMQAMDVFLLPSRFEGLPLVLVEAQCTGLKCITYEGVSEEAKITKLLSSLPYDKKIWKEEVQKNIMYERKDQSKVIEYSGYSLKRQIQEIEEIYRGEK